MKAKAEKEVIKEGKEQGESELLIKQLIKKDPISRVLYLLFTYGSFRFYHI